MSNVIPFERPKPKPDPRKRRGSKTHDIQLALLIIDERADHMEKVAREMGGGAHPIICRDAARIREMVKQAWGRLGYRNVQGNCPDDQPTAS
jgi:hypothetical protein